MTKREKIKIIKKIRMLENKLMEKANVLNVQKSDKLFFCVDEICASSDRVVQNIKDKVCKMQSETIRCLLVDLSDANKILGLAIKNEDVEPGYKAKVDIELINSLMLIVDEVEYLAEQTWSEKGIGMHISIESIAVLATFVFGNKFVNNWAMDLNMDLMFGAFLALSIICILYAGYIAGKYREVRLYLPLLASSILSIKIFIDYEFTFAVKYLILYLMASYCIAIYIALKRGAHE